MQNENTMQIRKTETHLYLGWDKIQSAMESNGGIHILDSGLTASQRNDRNTSVFIELLQGHFAGEWLFLNTKWAILALANTDIVDVLSMFENSDYLVSIHDADGH
jgi:hypothetical protein